MCARAHTRTHTYIYIFIYIYKYLHNIYSTNKRRIITDVKKIMTPLFPHFKRTKQLPLYNSSIPIFLRTDESKRQAWRYEGCHVLLHPSTWINLFLRSMLQRTRIYCLLQSNIHCYLVPLVSCQNVIVKFNRSWCLSVRASLHMRTE